MQCNGLSSNNQSQGQQWLNAMLISLEKRDD